MAISIYRSCLLTLFLLAVITHQQTNIIYYSEYEVQQEDDFIEVTLEVESQSKTLTQALSSAAKTANDVAALANSYCNSNTKKGQANCKDAVEISMFEIEPQYNMVRKQAIFSTFVVTHQITIHVFETDRIGYLIDSFLRFPLLTIKGFEWLPFEEVDSEDAAIKEGIEMGEGYCNQVGLTLGKILGIEEIVQEEEDAPEQEEAGEEQEEDAEIVTYKFEVQCIPTKPKTKAKPKAK